MTKSNPKTALTTDCTTDYLIVGSGAVGMAFADTLFHETHCRMVIVDRHHGPGGHWNDAYPFVRLHQPSAYYGVNSKPLGTDSLDASGLNVGMYERATSSEIVAYYEQLMQSYVASGRVQYFPMSDYVGDWQNEHAVVSLMTGAEIQVVASKIVDTTILNTAVPSTHAPKYAMADGVRCMPLNDLPRIRHLKTPPSGYVVVGAGKTGIDACIWLLENGTPPERITWIKPRDSWFQNRAKVQPGKAFFEASYGGFAEQMEILAKATSVDDVMAQLEAGEHLMRIDKSVDPTMYHGALISKSEIALLSTITNVVRMGRIVRVEHDQIILEKGTVPTDVNRLYVDCSASAVQFSAALESTPIFEGNKITPQFVRTFQPTFSAAFVAHVEATASSVEEKNLLCGVIPMPDKPMDWVRMQAANLKNQYRWSKNKELKAWIKASRLDGFTKLAMQTKPWEFKKINLLRRYGMNAGPAAVNLKKLLAE
jgi:NAD(P)-binding Rossmann-like domain